MWLNICCRILSEDNYEQQQHIMRFFLMDSSQWRLHNKYLNLSKKFLHFGSEIFSDDEPR